MPTKRLLFAAVACGLLLVVLEGVLHALCVVSGPIDRVLAESPSAPIPICLVDPVLGQRPNPAYPSHDTRGYRNKEAREHATVVALGDSQTYGMGVSMDEAWPRQYETLGGDSTYSIAFGGFGPTQGLALTPLALSLRPGVVVYGLYAGNDLFDCFSMVHLRGQLPELGTADPAVAAAIADAERSAPIHAQIDGLFAGGHTGVRGVLARHSKLYGVVRAVKRAVLNPFEDPWTRAQHLAQASGGREEAVEIGRFRTVLTSTYRLCGLNLDDVRIAEGHRVCLEALRRIEQQVTAAGARFVVALIPTKELVFEAIIAHQGVPVSEDFTRLVACEREMWQRTRRFLGEHSIEWVDCLVPLRGCLDEGRQPYPENADGHPNAAGQQAIAAAVAAALEGR